MQPGGFSHWCCCQMNMKQFRPCLLLNGPYFSVPCDYVGVKCSCPVQLSALQVIDEDEEDFFAARVSLTFRRTKNIAVRKACSKKS